MKGATFEENTECAETLMKLLVQGKPESEVMQVRGIMLEELKQKVASKAAS